MGFFLRNNGKRLDVLLAQNNKKVKSFLSWLVLWLKWNLGFKKKGKCCTYKSINSLCKDEREFLSNKVWCLANSFIQFFLSGKPQPSKQSNVFQ